MAGSDVKVGGYTTAERESGGWQGQEGPCSLVKAVLILWMEGVMAGDTLIGYRMVR